MLSQKSNSFLEIDPQNEDKLFDTLLEKIRKGDSIGKCAPINKPQFECGFCLKTRDDKKRKVFVNFCISEEVEYPKLDLTEDELSSLLQSEMLSAFKIPMLIEELRPTVDKSGDRNSLVCDIIINEEFYNKRVVSSELYKTLLVTVTLEAIESKNANAITLDKNKWIILKNKKYQNAVNNSSSKSYGERQLVTELNSLPSSSANSAPGVDHLDECMKEFDIGDEQQQDMRLKVVKNKRKETSSIIDERTPKYKLNFDLSARTLTLTAHLLKLKSTKDLHLMLNDDRISLLSNEYELDLFIPINVVANEARAQFNKSNQRFTLTVPVSEC